MAPERSRAEPVLASGRALAKGLPKETPVGKDERIIVLGKGHFLRSDFLTEMPDGFNR